MTTYYYVLDKQGEYLFDNFPQEAKGLVSDYFGNINPFGINIGGITMKARMGKKCNENVSIYVLTTDSQYIKRKNKFKELLDLSSMALKPIVNFKNELVNSHIKEKEEFIHNVTSLNSYAIQEVFTLIPQNVLTENINKQNDTVREIIKEKPNVTVTTLLNLIKYSLATKVEFSVFERTLKPSAFVSKSDFPIRPIILSILQIFILDFEKHKIEVKLDACDKSLNIDYDSLFVSLYYLFDNSVKYCCPRTTFKIIFKQEGDDFSILFIMISIKIEKKELEKITTRGFRSETAKKLNVEGSGIGMYRMLKTLKLNNAELIITPKCNSFSTKVKEIEYEGNEFKVKFINQKEWF